jgi:hypothetical protein
MKKFLLVMLVPVLVLGLFSCGEADPVATNGSAAPIVLQKSWTDADGIACLSFSGNQATVLNYGQTGLLGDAILVPFRIDYDGPTHTEPGMNGWIAVRDEEDVEFSVTFYDFDSPYKEAGTMYCTMDDALNDTFQVTRFEPSDEAKYYSDILLVVFKTVDPDAIPDPLTMEFTPGNIPNLN